MASHPPLMEALATGLGIYFAIKCFKYGKLLIDKFTEWIVKNKIKKRDGGH